MWDSAKNPLEELGDHQGYLVLDGGLATELERHGHDLADDLWSAKILIEDPDAIRQVHLDFLSAGADCITSSSYQASFEGFERRGLEKSQASRLMQLSVRLALQARDEFWSDSGNRADRIRPLVAASVGPYGAYLADGSEYRGDYAVDRQALYDFHRPRWRLLAECGADLLACETIPSSEEAEVLLRLLRESPDIWAWLSFSCHDGDHLNDGTRIVDVARECDLESGVAAIGVNCTAPEFISALISQVRKVTNKPVIVYPNAGGQYDGHDKSWGTEAPPTDWENLVREWVARGANAIGGCCRVGPQVVSVIRRQLAKCTKVGARVPV